MASEATKVKPDSKNVPTNADESYYDEDWFELSDTS